MKVVKKLIVVPYYDDAGDINTIDLTDTLDSTWVQANINNADQSQRWYVLPIIKNVENVRADSVYEDFNDGSRAFIRDGIRSVTGIIPAMSSVFLGKIQEYRCKEIGVYAVDASGNIIGSYQVADNLYPIKIAANTWDAQLVLGTDSAIQKVMLKFDFDFDEKDANLRMITTDEYSGFSALALNGLLDVYAEYSSISTTGFTAKLYTDYGTAITPGVFKGLVAGDFALYNVTDSSAVTIATVTESPDGTYAFTFTAQTSADVLRLTPTKNGGDFSAVVASTITIP